MPSVRIEHELFLKGAAGPIEVATASVAISRVVNSLNTMGGDLWSKLNDDNPQNLFDLGIHASVMVFIPSFSTFARRIFHSYLC